MKDHKRTEEQQKDYIFDIFSKCRSETVSNRLQVHYSRLCEQIYLWYKDYLPIDVDEMGLEITEVTNHFTKVETISKIPDDKNGFFKYLTTSIKNKEKESHREYNENDTMKITKEQKQKLKEVQGFIRMKESQLERTLTADERMQGVSKWFKKQEYVGLLNSMNVGSLSYNGSDGNKEKNVLDSFDTHSDSPLDEYIKKADMEAVRETVESLLKKKQARSRDCYRALFTLHCIKNYKNLEGLYPVLDKNVLETCREDGKTPNQYEIYQKYNPKAKKPGAEAMASKNLREFLSDIEACLKEKNVKFPSKKH